MLRRNPSATEQMATHPLTVAVSMWGLVMGVLVLIGLTPSATIDSLPRWESFAWGAFSAAAGASILVGLFALDSMLAVSRGMMLLALTTTVYWITLIYVTGWGDGGVAASFLLVVSVVIGREGVLLRRRTVSRTGGSGGRTE